MTTEIYAVMAETGEYAHYKERIVCIYLSEELARRHVVLAEHRWYEILISDPPKGCTQQEHYGNNIHDPLGYNWSHGHGVKYRIDGVMFREEPPE